MNTLAEQLISEGFSGRFITPDVVQRLVGGSDSRRWGLVHRAMENGAIIRLRRGLYLLSPKLSGKEVSRFCIANRLLPGSYVSLESALGFNGWLQEESLLVQSCLSQGRSKTFKNSFGDFSYEIVPVGQVNLLKGVRRLQLPGGPALVASPERALVDTVYNRKLKWEGIIGLCELLRTDVSNVYHLDTNSLRELAGIYRSAAVRTYCSELLVAMEGKA
jgi:predicted transcriptional regulator of viral defense system